MDQQLAHLVGTALTGALMLFILYRRFRRNFGRQPLKRQRLITRIWVLAVVGLLLMPFALFSWELRLATLGGLLIGAGLGVWGAKHTRFEMKDGVLHYIPHTYAGMVVSALFLGRLLYRFVVLSPSMYSVVTIDTGTPSMSDFGGLSGISHNPATRFIFFILVGYYIYYYGYVLYESKHLKPEDYEKPADPDRPGGNL